MADLMYRVYTQLIITQVPKATDKKARNLKLELGFCNTWESEENWTDLTNNAKITIPKNIYAIDAKTGQRVTLAGSTNADTLINNLFQRGDKVQITAGYYRYDAANGGEILDKSTMFNGYISKVHSKMPVVLDIEDNMWRLKQLPCKPQTWPKNKTVEDLLKSLLTGTNFTVNAITETTVGDLIIQDESVAQLLARLRKDFHLEAYFATAQNNFDSKGNIIDPDKIGCELRIGSLVYLPPNPQPKEVFTFVFQKNIISDELNFSRKDDIKLSAVCTSVNTVKTGKTNKAGEDKTKEERLEVLVWSDPVAGWKYRKREKDKEFPANEEGERRTLFFPNITDAAKLAQLGANELVKFYYEGFKGKFTTFAIPNISLGDYIKIEDKVLPDRTGYYVVKGVNKSGGVNGGRQVIELAYKLVVKNNTLSTPTTSKPIPG